MALVVARVDIYEVSSAHLLKSECGERIVRSE